MRLATRAVQSSRALSAPPDSGERPALEVLDGGDELAGDHALRAFAQMTHLESER